MKFLTVGWFGQLASGKDCAADYLVSRLNETDNESAWIRKGFAHAVKKIFMDTFGVDWDFVEKWKRIDEPPPGFDRPIRDCLIRIGDGFRYMKSSIWIELAFRNLNNHQCISDGRYLNEALYIKSQGGINILMWRPNYENTIDNPSEQQLMPYVRQLAADGVEGVLENPQIPFDIFIINRGTLDDLYNKIDEIVVTYVTQQLKKLNENSGCGLCR